MQIFNESQKNTFHSYISNKSIKRDEKHQTWMTKVVKSKSKFKENGYKKSKFLHKLAEPLYIKENSSSLNARDTSVPPKLFN